MTFYKWLHDAGLVGMSRREIDLMEEAWNAADKAAREECAGMCKEISREIDNSDSYYFNLNFKDGKVAGSDQCEEAIRTSITGESRQNIERDENANGILSPFNACMYRNDCRENAIVSARAKEALGELARYFLSGNDVTVERATILAHDFWRITGLTPDVVHSSIRMNKANERR